MVWSSVYLIRPIVVRLRLYLYTPDDEDQGEKSCVSKLSSAALLRPKLRHRRHRKEQPALGPLERLKPIVSVEPSS